MSKPLKKLLKKVDVQETLALSDAKLGNIIKDKLDVQCVASTAVNELIRCIRSQSDSLLTGLEAKDVTAMRLGLAHRCGNKGDVANILMCETQISVRPAAQSIIYMSPWGSANARD